MEDYWVTSEQYVPPMKKYPDFATYLPDYKESPSIHAYRRGINTGQPIYTKDLYGKYEPLWRYEQLGIPANTDCVKCDQGCGPNYKLAHGQANAGKADLGVGSLESVSNSIKNFISGPGEEANGGKSSESKKEKMKSEPMKIDPYIFLVMFMFVVFIFVCLYCVRSVNKLKNKLKKIAKKAKGEK